MLPNLCIEGLSHEPSLPAALLVNTVAALTGWRLRTVSAAGALTGALIGAVVYASIGPTGWLFLFVSFTAAMLSSRLGLPRKRLRGIAEDADVRRDAASAVANCLVAVVAAVVSTGHWHDAALVGFVASLTAGASDTVASEVGKAWGRGTRSLPTLRPARAGEPGGVSLEGTTAGVAAAFALVSLGVALGLVSRLALVPVVAGAVVGGLVESTLGATLEPRRILGSQQLNLINTLVAAAVAVALAW
jgi:uncharacterized protein (TIGR00297 family)